MNRRSHAGVALTALALALLAGCSLPQGPAGVVVSKANRVYPASKYRPYYLTVRTTDGTRKDFQVYIHEFDNCTIGEHYPACTKSRP